MAADPGRLGGGRNRSCSFCDKNGFQQNPGGEMGSLKKVTLCQICQAGSNVGKVRGVGKFDIRDWLILVTTFCQVANL